MTRPPSLRGDVFFFELDGAAVLLAEREQRVFGLNTSSAYIWCCIAEGMSQAEAAARLQHDHALSAEEARCYVAMAVAQWQDWNLLGDATSAGERARPLAAQGPTTPHRPMDTGVCYATQRAYRLLDSVIRIRFNSAAQAQWAIPVFRHLETSSRDFATVLDVVYQDGRHWVYRDGHALADCAALPELAPLIKGLIIQAAVNASSYFAYLHAGVVSDGVSCVLLPGVSGSGKSCLTATLLRAGLQYFSDEVALLEHRSLDVRPFPIALGLKEGAWNLLRADYPQIRDLDVHRREDGKRVSYLPPPREAMPVDLSSGRGVSHVVFPRFVPAAEVALSPLHRVEVLQRLMDDCVVLPGRLSRESLQAFVDWLERARCYELTYSALPGARDAVSALLASAGSDA